jgi:hypothetical protein
MAPVVSPLRGFIVSFRGVPVAYATGYVLSPLCGSVSASLAPGVVAPIYH